MGFLNKTTDYTINGKCSGCGSCCNGILPLSAAEVAEIRRYIEKHRIKAQTNALFAAIDGTCPFRDASAKKCTIYPIRPAVCREFLCNKTQEQIATTREYFASHCEIVFLRSEFYGDHSLPQFFKLRNLSELRGD